MDLYWEQGQKNHQKLPKAAADSYSSPLINDKKMAHFWKEGGTHVL